MDTHPTQSPTSTPGAVEDTSWRSSASGHSEPVRWDANTLEAAQLNRYYLDCARDSFPQGTYGEAACSQVADLLLARRFDGNFNRMVEWWRTATCLGPDRRVFTRCR